MIEPITISLPTEQLLKLDAIAKRNGVSSETFLQSRIFEWLDDTDENFERVVSEVLKEHAELYRRLA